MSAKNQVWKAGLISQEEKNARSLRRFEGVALVIFAGICLLVAAAFMINTRPPVYEFTPSKTGQPERCLTCHLGIEQISGSHPVAEFGCISCHGGDRLATDEKAAHTGMVRNPAALNVADRTCGSCHPAQVITVQRSIMATYAGAIGLVRRTFGQQTDGKARYASVATGDLPAFNASPTDPAPVQHFAVNCLTCHLTADPINQPYFYRSTGCSSCHVLYNTDGLYQGKDRAIPKDKPGYPAVHQFTTAIPYTQCNHCHNRGNYDLRTMAFIQRTDLPAPAGLSAEALRAHDYYQPIGKFTKCEFELDCIDCHTQTEIMGNGVIANNRSEVRYTQCASCHGTQDKLPDTAVIQSQTDPAITSSRLNPLAGTLHVGDTIMITSRGEPRWNIRLENGQWVLIGKATGTHYQLPLVMGSKCKQKPDQQDSRYCHECHAYNKDGP